MVLDSHLLTRTLLPSLRLWSRIALSMENASLLPCGTLCSRISSKYRSPSPLVLPASNLTTTAGNGSGSSLRSSSSARPVHEIKAQDPARGVKSLSYARGRTEARPIVPEKHTKQHVLTVAVDIDEVLGSFLTALNMFVAEQYLLEHTLSEYHVYDFTEIWRCSRAEADLRVHAFFKSEHFDKGITPIPGAYKSLQQLAEYCELYVVTSRQNIIKEETIAWIERHYSGIFKEVHFGNHYALEGESRTKSEICRGVGAQVLVDDNPGYALDCARNGIEVLLFDYNKSYPWSKTAECALHPLITRVHNWEEVVQALSKKAQYAQQLH